MSISLLDLKYYNAYVWWFYSMLSLLPLLFLSLYKLFYPIKIHLYNDKSPFPHLLQDKIARVFLFWAPIYYIFDMIISLMIGHFDRCQASFFFHHIVSIIFLPSVIFQKHYPWFLCFVPGFHAVLLAFPHATWLNFAYLIACALYQFGLYQEPFRNMRSYRFLQKGTWILEVALVMLWGFGCKNNFWFLRGKYIYLWWNT